MCAPGGSSGLARRLSAVIAVMVESSVIIPAVVSASLMARISLSRSGFTVCQPPGCGSFLRAGMTSTRSRRCGPVSGGRPR